MKINSATVRLFYHGGFIIKIGRQEIQDRLTMVFVAILKELKEQNPRDKRLKSSSWSFRWLNRQSEIFISFVSLAEPSLFHPQSQLFCLPITPLRLSKVSCVCSVQNSSTEKSKDNLTWLFPRPGSSFEVGSLKNNNNN